MERTTRVMRQCWRSLNSRLRLLNTWLIVLVVFWIYTPIGGIGGVYGGPINQLYLSIHRLFATDEPAAYKDAIVAAAIKQPGYEVPLTPIPATTVMVDVVNFGPRYPTPPDARDRKFDLWVALPDDLKKVCVGAPDPAWALEQFLGKPPDTVSEYVVTELTVPRDALFRPCLDGADVGANTCKLSLPPEPSDTTLREAYNQLRFVTDQMLNSYQVGFARKQKTSPSDYPYEGFPFTGMGWTYNWSKSSPNHVGVSEFVIKRDAVISVVGTKTAAEFCTKPS